MFRIRTKSRGSYESQREAGVGCKFTKLPCSKSLFRHKDLVEISKAAILFEKNKRHLRNKVMVLT